MQSSSIRRLAALVLLLPGLTFCQEFRATINGVVTDQTGSPIAGVKIAVNEISTNTAVNTTSDSKGEYNAPFLQPGDYTVTAKIDGFKEYVRKGLHLGAGDKVSIDIKLEIGNATESISVSADAPLLNSENASVGQTISTKEVESLPLNGGTPLALAALASGVIATGQPGLIHPFDAGAAAGWSIGGSPSQTNEILINGSPDATWDGRLAYSPPKDAVLEVKINAFDSDAAFGHTGGGVLNQVLKSGSNDIHGSLFEQNQPNTTVANNYFNNKNGLGNPVTHYNQYGLTAGGPVWIPKVFNGRNKLFWFFAWESLKDSQPNTNISTVPTAAERNGDFSALLAAGASYQLYNPASAVVSSTGVVTRTAFPGNIIPPSQLSSIAKNVLQFIPAPNVTPSGGRADGFGNYGSTASTPDDYNNEIGRIDYNMSERNRMFVDVRRTGYLQSKNNYYGNQTTGSLLTRNNTGASFDDIITVSPTNIVDLRLNFTRLDETHPSPSAGFDPTTLGLPGIVNQYTTLQQFPYVTWSSASGLTAMGSNGANKLPSQSLQFFGTWVTLKGNHSIKTGLDVRQYNLNVYSYGNSVGNYDFSANTYVRSASNASSTVVLGQDIATFLLGLPTKVQYDVNTSAAYYQHYFATFVQDDWRVKPNLTINLGIRFDHDSPYHEKFGRTTTGFDPTLTNPLAAAATAAYAKNPTALLKTPFAVNGGLAFPSAGDAAIFDTTSHLFSPRIGLAWTPGFLHGKTVIRAGFGMFVTPVSIASLSLTGAYSTNPILTQEGFSQSTTTTTTSNDNFVTPALTFANPFPGGIKLPVGAALGAGTFNGQTINYLDPNQKNPYSLRWNFNIQKQLAKNTVLEVSYIGNHGVHLPVTVTQLNVIPRQYLSTLNSRDTAVINALSASIANPFAGLNTSTAGATTTVAQLLATYPQYPVGSASGSTGVIDQNSHIGSSYFQSVNVRLQKRFGSGVSIVANYIHSKLIERISWLNDTDPTPEKRLSPFDHPNRIVTSVSYELPFGKGKKFDFGGSKILNMIAGGWSANSIYTFQVGAPLVWSNGSTTSPGDYLPYGNPIVLNNRETNTVAFNTSNFNTNASQQFQYHIRTFSTTFGNLRQDGINQLDTSLLKRIQLRERVSMEIRAEAYNLINHPTFSAPNTTETNSQFGLITTQANRPRTMMFGARIKF